MLFRSVYLFVIVRSFGFGLLEAFQSFKSLLIATRHVNWMICLYFFPPQLVSMTVATVKCIAGQPSCGGIIGLRMSTSSPCQQDS
jgi:hypothetical protein